MASLPAMLDGKAVDDMKRDRDEHGDEIGLYFGDLQCPAFRDKFGSDEFAFWLFSMEAKRRIAEFLFDRYRRCFGSDPVSIGAYMLDAPSLNLLKELCPPVQAGIAACFEVRRTSCAGRATTARTALTA